MSKIKSFVAAMLLVPSTVFAGGLLTNTNQSVAFLRNPARDAIIAIDGVYSNPAGLAFLNRGFHAGLNIQSAYQNRDVTSTFFGFAYGKGNNGQTTKKFHGNAVAPVIPSVQLAYKMDDRWAFSFNFAVGGGGGKCEFDEGLGSFESVVSLLPFVEQKASVTGYSLDSYMRGKQYYYGFQLGASYKITDHLSAFVGGRLVYGSCNYYGYVKNIAVNVSGQDYLAASYCAQQYKQYLLAAGSAEAAGDLVAYRDNMSKASYFGTLAAATQDVELNCDQEGWGFTPIVGLDYKVGKFNFAAKYEFRTRMSLENRSANSQSAENLSSLNAYADGESVRSDIPGLLTVGVQYEPIPSIRLSAGYHWYNDKNAKAVNDKHKLLDGDTHEVLAGIEYDINKWLQVSAGWQKTMYGLTDDYMNDMSFVTSSNSFGVGFGFKVAKNVKVNASYFQTFYDTYDKHTSDYNNLSQTVYGISYNIHKWQGEDAGQTMAQAYVDKMKNHTTPAGTVNLLQGTDSFKRTNIVFGLGVELTF